MKVRPARPEDSAALARLANALDGEIGGQGHPFTTARMLADGFGPEPKFCAVIAEARGRIVGYAMFYMGYDTDTARPSLILEDLYVVPWARSAGTGRRLMRAVAAEAGKRGAATMQWAVLDSNRRGRRFYAGIGARDRGLRVLSLDGPALRRLARETGPVTRDAGPVDDEAGDDSGSPRRRPDETWFYDAIGDRLVAASVAHLLIEWLRPRVDELWWGARDDARVVVPVVIDGDGDRRELAIISSRGTIEVLAPYDHAVSAALRHRLDEVPGIDFPGDIAGDPLVIALPTLDDGIVLRGFVAALIWHIDAARSPAVLSLDDASGSY